MPGKSIFRISLFAILLGFSVSCEVTELNTVPDHTAFIKFYGGINQQEGNDIIQTSDDGFLVVGSTSSFGNGGSDVYVIKVDLFGNEEWSRTYGGEFDDFGRSITITSDNNYAIAGDFGYEDGSSDMYLLKIDGSGNVLSDQKFGNNTTDSHEHGNEIRSTLDGGFIIVGSSTNTDVASNGPLDFYLVKTDNEGILQWQRTRGFENSAEEGQSVIQLDAERYVVVGTTENARENEMQAGKNVFAYMINRFGDNIGNRFYGGLEDDLGSKIMKTVFGYAIVGTTASAIDGNSGGNDNVFIIQIDENLNELAINSYGGPNDDVGIGMTQLPDGGFLIVGASNSFSSNLDNPDIFLLKTDFSGNLVEDWILEPRTFGGEGYDQGNSVIQTEDGFVIVGTSTFFEATENRMINLIKTNKEGQLID